MMQAAGDQTRGDSTPFFTGGQSASLSRNEVAALCMKAARGAGMSWGMAEEAGFAASWLTAIGLDGPRHLLDHLTEAQGREWGDLCPVVTPGAWNPAPGRSMCPIALGATMSDHAALPTGLSAGPIRVGPVDHPLLLCPFLAAIANDARGVVVVEWDGGSLDVDAQGASPRAAFSALEGRCGVTLTLSIRQGETVAPTGMSVPAIAAETIIALNAFALRTTVPASAASRAGAGAATGDND